MFLIVSSAQRSTSDHPIKKPRGRNSNKKSTTPTPANNIVNTTPVTQLSGKVPKKRASKRPLNEKVMKVQYVEQDEHGNYKLPVQIGILTVLSLGSVVYDRDTFHNERYIWPVGYAVKRYLHVYDYEDDFFLLYLYSLCIYFLYMHAHIRAYNSMINPDSQTMYVCKIDDGNEGPKVVLMMMTMIISMHLPDK